MAEHRITLAEDDADALFLLHRLVERLYPHSSISSFSNAEDALLHILSTGTDLLITNHGMGQMSGAELIRRLRAARIEIPILMMSGNPKARKEAEEVGATSFLEKSLDMKAVEQRIRELLPV
jgi:DNA-binding response OmpR family regulator